MSSNPLFPSQPTDDSSSDSYVLPKNNGRLEPLQDESERNAATEVIRHKLDKIYADEPDALEELEEVQEDVKEAKPLSKHQVFMQELNQSGKSLAEIQTEWHHYYTTLPDNEKYEVWQEFYESNANTSTYHANTPKPKPTITPSQTAATLLPPEKQAPQPKLVAVHTEPATKTRSRAAIKRKIVNKVNANGKLKAKHHFQSLIFGLSIGAVVVFIMLFSFFNEVLIAPFIQPSRHAAATPLILSTDGVAPTANPEVIIPKINVELPVDFSQTSTDENTIENALESGVVHYPTTVMPGQNGNTAFFGHSSNNIFNKGKYKFAFVLLHELVPGDTFYITNNSKVYVYKVITKDIVPPTDVSVLGPVDGQKATATLITCDPPGTSLNRLIIVGQQISPDPGSNTEGTTTATSGGQTVSPAALPGNGPTLFRRLWNAIF